MSDTEKVMLELKSAVEWFEKHGRNTNTAIIGICKRAYEEINRQQAEVERLQKLLSGAKDCIDEIEYAMNKVGTSNDRIDEALEEWNNLVKEMTEVSE